MISLIAAAVLCGGCSWTKKKPRGPVGSLPPLSSEDPAVQRSFDAALAELKAGRWEEARASFDAIERGAPSDPLAPLAAMYARRAQLGALSIGPGGALEAGAGAAAAGRALERWAPPEGDDRVRFADAIYRALAQLAAGRQGEALLGLERYPGASLSPAVLERDRAAAWMIVVEAMARAGRGVEVLEAAAALRARAPEHRALSAFALARASEAAEGSTEPAELRALLGPDTDPFARAVAAGALLRRAAEGEVRGDDRFALYEIGAEAWAALGAPERASALEAYLRDERRGAEPARVGALLPLSGPLAPVGRRAMRGVILASRLSQGVPVIFADANLGIARGFEELERAGAVAVVGPMRREAAAEAAAEARRRSMPTLALASVEPAPAEEPWLFDAFLDLGAEARALARAAKARGVGSVYALSPAGAYGDQASALFEQAGREAGLRIAGSRYDDGSVDDASLAGRVAAAKPRALFVPDAGRRVARLAANLAREGVAGGSGGVTYLGTSVWLDPFLLDQAGGAIEGAIIAGWYAPGLLGGPQGDFEAAIARQWPGAEADVVAALARDATAWLLELAARRGQGGGAAIRAGLLGGASFEGVTGTARYDESGRAVRVPRLYTVRSGRFVPLGAEAPR